MDNLCIDVSVIFATHNRQDILEQVFNAWRVVDKSTKYSYEIICSDDESDDNTKEIIRSIKDLPIKLIENKKGGAAKARNAALKIAAGKLVIFTGDDIFPTENYINAHYENYLKYGENVATLGRIDWHPALNRNYLMKHITEVGCEQFGFIALPTYQLIDFRHFYTSNISVPRRLLNSLDKFFNTDFDKYGFEDIELGYRLQKSGMKIYYDPDILAYHHHMYDSVEKFCNRQVFAGEELVVFSHMHEDLEDKCICDVENCKLAFQKYKKNHPGRSSVKGWFLKEEMMLAKSFSMLLERRISGRSDSVNETLCSLIYAAIFRFSFYYGIAIRIAQECNLHTSENQIIEFAYEYMRKPFHEIYWNIGRGFNENDARKWNYWDSSDVILKKELPEGVSEIRIAPLKDFCKAYINEMKFELKSGELEDAKIEWHNACKFEGTFFDFSNTNDSCILIKDIPESYKSIYVKLKVEFKKRNMNIYRMARNAAARMFHRVECKVNNSSEWDIQYAYGQRRRIQIGIISNFDSNRKKQLIKEYQDQVSILGDDVIVSDAADMKMGYVNYLYDPCCEPLDITQLLQVAYTLMNHIADYVVVSKAYIEYPQIACKDIHDVIIYNSLLADADQKLQLKSAIGRYMRLPAYKPENKHVNIDEIFPFIQLNNKNCLGAQTLLYRISQRIFGKRNDERPLIFVIPIFLAVGGIERNTIEVMRKLKSEYDFCMITMEYHTEHQGSLHYQLEGICKYIFDLREITNECYFLETLYELNQMFNPQLIWLCNNSPWFEQHTAQIRNIFRKIPIIAQDVYDTKAGWIEYYNNPEVKSFDRYIAITQLIRDTFIKTYHIPEERIDVIYPTVNDKKINQVKKNNLPYDVICEKYGLDKEKQHFSYIARLAEQKDPLRYLKLVKNVTNIYTDLQFIMVGDGIYKDRIDDYIIQNDIQDKLIRIPYVENVPELLRVLDGLIITSVFEGMPIVCIEALSMGIPVFSTNSGDTKRFVEKYQNGLIINEKESDIVNFQNFYQNLEEYKENALCNSKTILDYFSISNISKQYYDVFHTAVHEKILAQEKEK